MARWEGPAGAVVALDRAIRNSGAMTAAEEREAFDNLWTQRERFATIKPRAEQDDPPR